MLQSATKHVPLEKIFLVICLHERQQGYRSLTAIIKSACLQQRCFTTTSIDAYTATTILARENIHAYIQIRMSVCGYILICNLATVLLYLDIIDINLLRHNNALFFQSSLYCLTVLPPFTAFPFSSLVLGIAHSLSSNRKLSISLWQRRTVKYCANAVLATALAQTKTRRRGVCNYVASNRLCTVLRKAHAITVNVQQQTTSEIQSHSCITVARAYTQSPNNNDSNKNRHCTSRTLSTTTTYGLATTWFVINTATPNSSANRVS
jgi:hypothetical protein